MEQQNDNTQQQQPSIEEVLASFDGRKNFKPEKPAYLSIAGLVLGILGWCALFFLPKSTQEDFSDLLVQIYIMLAVSVVAILLSVLGHKRAPGISFFGYVISGALFLFFIIDLIVLNLLD